MDKIPAHQADFQTDLDAVFYYLCASWGYCHTGLSGSDFVDLELTADELTCHILAAEGMNPEAEIKPRRAMRQFFKDRYGDAISDKTYRAPN